MLKTPGELDLDFLPCYSLFVSFPGSDREIQTIMSPIQKKDGALSAVPD